MTDINECVNCKMVAFLKELINTGKMYEGGLIPQLSCRDQTGACEIHNEFIANTELKLACFGTTSWGRRQHYIYRHDDGRLFTFCVSGGLETISDIDYLSLVDTTPDVIEINDDYLDDVDYPWANLEIGEGAGSKPFELDLDESTIVVSKEFLEVNNPNVGKHSLHPCSSSECEYSVVPLSRSHAMTGVFIPKK